MSEWFEGAFWNKLYPFLFSKDVICAEHEVGSVLEQTDAMFWTLPADRVDMRKTLAKKGFRRSGPVALCLKRPWTWSRRAPMSNGYERTCAALRPDAFDLVINIFTAFGYFDDKRDDIKVLRNIHQIFAREVRLSGIDGQGVPGQRISFDDVRGVGRRQAPGGADEICDDWVASKTNGSSSRRHDH